MLRINRIVSDFENSSEIKDLGFEDCLFVGTFLKMMSDLCVDLTVPSVCPFSEDLAWAVEDLPAWLGNADVEAAPRMKAELVAFFEFAARTKALEHAARWLEFLRSMDLVGALRHTMRTDPRLTKKTFAKPTPKPKSKPKSKNKNKNKRLRKQCAKRRAQR